MNFNDFVFAPRVAAAESNFQSRVSYPSETNQFVIRMLSNETTLFSSVWVDLETLDIVKILFGIEIDDGLPCPTGIFR